MNQSSYPQSLPSWLLGGGEVAVSRVPWAPSVLRLMREALEEPVLRLGLLCWEG